MPEIVQPPDPPASYAGDFLFRRMVSGFTALSLAATYGWLGGFVRQSNGDLSFHWRWMVMVWTLIGLASSVIFWRKIWPTGNRAATRRGIIEGSIALALPGIWWLTLPLRVQSGQHLWQVAEGLFTAAMVLAFGAWMIIRLGRAFEDGERDK